MIAALGSYIRNIAVFLIFMSFAGIIVPSGKYKEYIDLFFGIVLVFILVSPLTAVFSGRIDVGLLLSSAEISLDRAAIPKEAAFYEDTQKKIILQAYRENLLVQLKMVVESDRKYEFLDGGFDIVEDDERFGELTSVYCEITAAEKNPLIKIDPVDIYVKEGSLVAPAEPEELALKKTLSGFYNLTGDNIHITVQRKSPLQ